MNNSNKQEEQLEAIVIEALPETVFKVLVEETGQEHLAYLAGKMRLNRIRVLIGDKVLIKTDPYGGKARIFKRI